MGEDLRDFCAPISRAYRIPEPCLLALLIPGANVGTGTRRAARAGPPAVSGGCLGEDSPRRSGASVHQSARLPSVSEIIRAPALSILAVTIQ